jgi:hypothetical protein
MRRHFRAYLWLSSVAAILPLLAAQNDSSQQQGGAAVSQYNVSYDQPGKTYRYDSLPLGNGDIGISAYAEEDGDLLFYLTKQDAYDDNHILLKLGRVRVKLTPNPFAKGQPYHEELDLHRGELTMTAGDGVNFLLWVDANHPVAHVEITSKQPLNAQVQFETWRKEDITLDDRSWPNQRNLLSGSGQPQILSADKVVATTPDQLMWYHQNTHSGWPTAMKLQGLESLTSKLVDPLQNRIFGGAITGDNLVKGDDTTLKTKTASSQIVINVFALTRLSSQSGEWQSALKDIIQHTEAVPLDLARNAHEQWWSDFWDRSWLRVTGETNFTPAIPDNGLSLNLGADVQGRNRLGGAMARARLWKRALSADEIQKLASASPTVDPAMEDDLVADWALGDLKDGKVPNRARLGLEANLVGNAGVITLDGVPSLPLNKDTGFLEVRKDERLATSGDFTLEAWVYLNSDINPDGARIMDWSSLDGQNGYSLRLGGRNSLRLAGVPGYEPMGGGILPSHKWTHVAVKVAAGARTFYIDGKEAATERKTDAVAMSRAYALQRYFFACAGRAGPWLKYNGSIFTPYDTNGPESPDYRRWGGSMWFQNTRHEYWPMLATGDYDLMQPLFGSYMKNLPMAMQRTQIYYHHDGAFFPETQTIFGTYADSDFGWDRANKPVGQCDSGYMRYYWQGGLELSAIMLDYYHDTQDQKFLKETLIPFASSILEFYDQHWPRTTEGKIHLDPSQSIEMWHKAVNPLPDIAGLHFVLEGMLAHIPGAEVESQRQNWQKMLADLPPVPSKTAPDGRKVLLPADVYTSKANRENPELYAIFPYRLYGVDKPNLDVGLNTYAQRACTGHNCWGQDGTQSAFLGQAGASAIDVSRRFCTIDPHYRFPIMYGPYADETPDLDNGGNAMMTLQTMLLQCEGDKILLFPAWPKGWNVEFKLHAPLKTTIEGIYLNGKVTELKVSPESRAKDVVQMAPQ